MSARVSVKVFGAFWGSLKPGCSVAVKYSSPKPLLLVFIGRPSARTDAADIIKMQRVKIMSFMAITFFVLHILD